jgi:hypothetical protein
MKCKRSIALMALVFALLLLPTIITYAKPPESVSGEWFYTPYKVEITKEVGGNTFKYGEEDGTWTGNFEGSSNDFFNVIAHPSGFVTCQGRINFEGTVNNKEGSMVILFVGKKNLETGLWLGKWVILSGTDDLENLNGQGTWSGPGWIGGPDPGELIYEGKIHFDPS